MKCRDRANIIALLLDILFSRGGTAWAQQVYLKAGNTDDGDQFGTALSLSEDGNALAVGAIDEDSSAIGIEGIINNSTNDSGAVYVYTRNGVNIQQTHIEASNTGVNDQFGVAISLSGDGKTLAVGAAYEDSNAIGLNGDSSGNPLGAAGAVYLY
ncbi:MAG TPA: hypothetical protein ENI98_07030 [Gammaproteobacteria bacterium]|nr:hypothetical protein [Gammaproteobacteria bacterium]